MGASSVSFILQKKATVSEIKEAFSAKQENDRYEYGHDAYNGTFSTIDSVKLHSHVFESEDEAYDYCLDNAEKWSYAIATYYKDGGKIKTMIAGWAAS